MRFAVSSSSYRCRVAHSSRLIKRCAKTQINNYQFPSDAFPFILANSFCEEGGSVVSEHTQQGIQTKEHKKANAEQVPHVGTHRREFNVGEGKSEREEEKLLAFYFDF
jgi:hypothetical protein